MKRIVAVSCLVLAVGIASAYAGCGTCDKSVVAAAAHNDDFKTLVAAVEGISGKDVPGTRHCDRITRSSGRR